MRGHQKFRHGGEVVVVEIVVVVVVEFVVG